MPRSPGAIYLQLLTFLYWQHPIWLMIPQSVAVSSDSCIFLHAQIKASEPVLICESTTMFSRGRGHRGLAAESRALKLHFKQTQDLEEVTFLTDFCSFYLLSRTSTDIRPCSRCYPKTLRFNVLHLAHLINIPVISHIFFFFFLYLHSP